MTTEELAVRQLCHELRGAGIAWINPPGEARGYGKTPNAVWTALVQEKVENIRLYKWINDLQSGMYINCVYCGHLYGPQDEVPASMADVLKRHIATCPKHPMSKLMTVLQSGVDLVERAAGHVSHGVATRDQAEKWVEDAKRAIADAKDGAA